MYKVAVIGAGPAGIAMGAELIESGLSPNDILICEKTDKDNASVRQFYPTGKDINFVYKNIETKQIGIMGFSNIISLDQYHKLIQDTISKYKLSFHFNTEVQKIVKDGNFFHLYTSNGEYQAEYVVLASGVFSKPRRPDYLLPASLMSQISFDIMKLQKDNSSKLDILVVGGGDSASEYVQSLAAMGNHVALSYRQDNFFRMNQLNKDRLNALVDEKKVSLFMSTNIESIEADGEKIKVLFQEKDSVLLDKFDRIVYSLGGASPTAFMDSCGLEYDDVNVILRENKETSIDKMFMIGDLATGRKGGSLMLAFNGAKEVLNCLKEKYQF
ncbi:MAG: NAD(P)-binding domain-containing protein [Brevinema sp.]